MESAFICHIQGDPTGLYTALCFLLAFERYPTEVKTEMLLESNINMSHSNRWLFGKDECMELRKALGAVLKQLEVAARGRTCVLISLHPKAILPSLLLAIAQCDLEERFCNVVTCVADLRLGMAFAMPAEADVYRNLGYKDAVDACRESWRQTQPKVRKWIK